jgi:hypothetical protein
MTHTLHRRGCAEDLREDYIVLITPAVGINHVDSAEKLRSILDKVFELGPNNIGSYETGTIYSGASLDEIKRQLSETPRVRCCFDDKEKVKDLLKFLVEKDFGLSVTVSGLMEEVFDLSKELNIKPHSANISLGIHGRVDSLPDPAVLDLVSLCGHGMVTASLVGKMIDDIKAKNISVDDAAELLARPCVCGIFNTSLAKKMLHKAASASIS